jgi:hypothetical protein
MVEDNQQGNETAEGQPQGTDQDTDPDVFSRDYVVRLRKENASLTGELSSLRNASSQLESRLAAIEQEKEAESKRKLEEQGEFKTLLDSERATSANLRQSLISDRIDSRLRRELAKGGITDEADLEIVLPGLRAKVNMSSIGDTLDVSGAADWKKITKKVVERFAPKTSNTDPNATPDPTNGAHPTAPSRMQFVPIVPGRPTADLQPVAVPTLREQLDSAVVAALAKHGSGT